MAEDACLRDDPSQAHWRMAVASFRCAVLLLYYTPAQTTHRLLGRLHRSPAGLLRHLLRHLRVARAGLIRRARSREKPPRRANAARTTEPDYYGILGLSAGSSIEQVRAQYRRLAKQHHPDLKGSSPFWQEHFKTINAARDFLTDPARKAAYDQRQATNEGPAS